MKEPSSKVKKLAKKLVLITIFSIDKKCVGHNTKINGAERYEGILTKSNFELYNTDVSPAFDFEWFVKKIEDE